MYGSDNLFEFGHRFAHRAEVAAAGCILVASAIEVVAGEEVDVEIALRTERNLDAVEGFDEHGREGDVLDTQRHVDDPFGVADLVVEAGLFGPRQG